MTTPWKWYVREPGGKGMWRAVDTEAQAIAAAAEWAEDGYEAEVGPLFDGGEVERLRTALGDAVGKRLTQEEAARTDGRMGPYIWWGNVPPGWVLYAAPPKHGGAALGVTK